MNTKLVFRKKNWLTFVLLFLFVLSILVFNTKTQFIVAQKNTYVALADSNKQLKTKIDECMQMNFEARNSCFIELASFLEERVIEFEQLANQL